MITFGERLKQLRVSKNLTQKEFATILNITERSYQRYEGDKSTPNYETLLFIANYFDVSLDYLVGRSNQQLVMARVKTYFELIEKNKKKNNDNQNKND